MKKIFLHRFDAKYVISHHRIFLVPPGYLMVAPLGLGCMNFSCLQSDPGLSNCMNRTRAVDLHCPCCFSIFANMFDVDPEILISILNQGGVPQITKIALWIINTDCQFFFIHIINSFLGGCMAADPSSGILLVSQVVFVRVPVGHTCRQCSFLQAVLGFYS